MTNPPRLSSVVRTQVIKEETVKSRTLTLITAMTLFATLALPLQLAAQQQTRYNLVDAGTLGGPNSFLAGPSAQTLNSRGTFVGFGSTSTPNPNPSCFVPFNAPDCFVENPLVWQNGVATLPVLPGGTNSQTDAISSSGLIAGWSENGLIDPMTSLPEGRAVLWTKERQIIDLGTLTGGTESLATAINSRGQIVGVSNNDVPDPFSLNGFPTQTRAFLWQNGAIQDLGTLGGSDALPNYVNERGQIAGFSYTSNMAVDPFLWENGTMIDLGTLGGSFYAQQGLNNRGQVVGTTYLAGDVIRHGFLWDRGSLLDLGTLGGDNSEAFWISDSGLVVGRADFSVQSTNHHAFLWKNGVMTDLGTLGPCLNSTAYSVNSNGQVVGDTGDCPGGGGGASFFSQRGEPMVDLNTLVLPGSDLEVVDAYDINDRGEIAGAAVLSNGDMHAVVLVPASETEIAAASALSGYQSPSTTVHTLVTNSENSVSGGWNRALNMFGRVRRRP